MPRGRVTPRHRRRRCGIARRKRPRDGPTDPTILRSHQRVLRRPVPAARRFQRVVEGLRGGDVEEPDIERVRLKEHPMQRDRIAVGLLVNDRPVAGGANGERLVARRSADADFLNNERLAAARYEVAVGISGVALEEHQIREVGGEVGEGPSNMAVASLGNERHAGQRKADERSARPLKCDAVPDAWGAEGEVHVVADDGAAVFGAGSRDGEGVGARRGFVGRANDGGGGNRGIGNRGIGNRGRGHGGAGVDVEDCGAGNRQRSGQRRAVDRHRQRPRAAAQKRRGLRGHAGVQRRAGAVGIGGTIEVTRHSQLHQQRVLRLPRLRRLAQHAVLERRAACQLRIDSLGVALEQRAMSGLEFAERTLRNRA